MHVSMCVWCFIYISVKLNKKSQAVSFTQAQLPLKYESAELEKTLLFHSFFPSIIYVFSIFIQQN